MKMTKLISAILCAVILTASLVSCDFITADKVDASGNLITEEDTSIDMKENYEVFEDEKNDFYTYKTLSVSEVKLSGSPVTDGKNNYFYFKLGTIKNVPVYLDDVATMHDGKTQTVYEWRQASITDNVFTEMQANCIANSVSTELTKSKTSSLSGTISARYKGVSAGMTASVKEGWAQTTHEATIDSQTQTFLKTVKDSVETSQTKTITIGKDSPAGYYRYTVWADAEVYAVAVCDIEQKTVEIAYMSVPIEKTYSEGFHYSVDNSSLRESEEKLALSEDALLEFGDDLFKVGYDMIKSSAALLEDVIQESYQDKVIKVENLESHLWWVSIDNFDEYYAKGYNKIDVEYSFYTTGGWSLIGGNVNIHGYIMPTNDKSNNIHHFNKASSKDGKEISGSATADLKWFQENQNVYILMENENITEDFTVSRLNIRIRIYHE